jgi:hypothetical protein
MSPVKGDQAFVDAIPELYDRLLVPLIFEHSPSRGAVAQPLRVMLRNSMRQ